MKLVASIYHMDELNDIKDYVDAILMDTSLIDLENIEKIISMGLTPILKYNMMVHPFEIEKYEGYFLKYKDTACLFYITDLGLAHLLKGMHLIHRTIFDPVTMITNHLDVESYMAYGFQAVGISNEITLRDVKTIYDTTKAPLYYQIFGYRQMLHSRRKLVSLYLEKINQTSNLENLSLEEVTRNEKYPIIENERGTFIYRSYAISLLKELTSLPVEYAVLESLFIPAEEYKKCLSLFFEVYHGKDSALAQEEFKALGIPTQDGFSYKDSVYMKEEF